MGIVWLASYPKSGNTWFRIFLTNLLRNGDKPSSINNMDNVKIASNREQFDNLLGVASSNLTEEEIDTLRPYAYELMAEETEAPLFQKIHDAYTYTPEGKPLVSPKATEGAVYFIRNPLDVAVSMASHERADIDDVIQVMNTEEHIANYFPGNLHNQLRIKFLTWSGHVLSWVDAPGLRINVMRYEDMVNKPVETFTRAVKFVGLPDDPERIARALEFSSFEELQSQEKENGFTERINHKNLFFRKGSPGDWRKQLTREQRESIIKDHKRVMTRFGYLDGNGEVPG